MAARKATQAKQDETVEVPEVESTPVDIPEEAVEDGPKPAVEVPSIMGSTFAERAAANKALAERRAESKG